MLLLHTFNLLYMDNFMGCNFLQGQVLLVRQMLICLFYLITILKRMSCGSKNEDRKQRERRRRFNGELGVTHSTRERQREREHRKTLFQNNALTQCTCVCVQCTLLYKSLEGLTEVLSYFNAL